MAAQLATSLLIVLVSSVAVKSEGEEANECIDHLLQQVATAGNRSPICVSYSDR